MLSYSVPFPTSLVLTHRSLLKYQLMFRHLLHLKWTERKLCAVWLQSRRNSAWTAPGLRMRMLAFVQQLQGYLTVEVIEPSWAEFINKFPQVKTVDELMSIHYYFIDRCIEGAMLTCGPLIKNYKRVITLCLDWCRWALNHYDAPQFAEYSAEVEAQFDQALAQLRDELDQRARLEFPVMTALLVRLDYGSW